MSAIPKKKLCWNCEGNVSRQIDNCPFCGVYLHAAEDESEERWNPSFQSRPQIDEENSNHPIPFSPLQDPIDQPDTSLNDFSPPSIYSQIRHEILPILLLMSGSVFFLFGVILLLFSQNGTLVLQWNGNHWPYFLIASIPSLIVGWKYFQDIPTSDSDNS